MRASMDTASGTTRNKWALACLFGTFVFAQYSILGLANHAGEGYLATEQRDLVYYGLQVFVILGFLLWSQHARVCGGGRNRDIVSYGFFGLCFACVAVMLLTSPASLGYVAVSMTAALCVGWIGGAVHLRMSRGAAVGARVARDMGIGSSVAVALQYLLQIRWGVTPLLSVFLLAAIAVLAWLLSHEDPAMVIDGGESSELITTRRLMSSVAIASIFILFACFYNEYIHHLMMQSGYGSYNVYSWPRLMFIPVYLLFAAIGDKGRGRYVPVVSLCIMLIALLTVVLMGSPEAYWLNMCIFYCTIAAYTCYYLLTFWRLAPGTRHPALWAPFGRMLDSAMVLVAGAINLSALPTPVVLGLDVAGVALVIVMMALGGDFNLADVPAAPEEPAPSLEERVSLLERDCGLTDRERDVLEALVLTEGTNQQIADSLHISRRQLQRHVSSIYEKTGTTSRAGLTLRASGETQPAEGSGQTAPLE